MFWKSAESSASAKQQQYFRRTRRATFWMMGICAFVAISSGHELHDLELAQLAAMAAIVFLIWGFDAHFRVGRCANRRDDHQRRPNPS